MSVVTPTPQPTDPLKEPRDARARLRQQRQAESAAKYNASYELRVAGGLLSCRETAHPVPAYKLQANLGALADSLVVGPTNAKPTTTHPQATSTSAPHAEGPHMEGRSVNIYGQTLDHTVPAIQQVLTGAFYTVRGNAVSELYAKKEGKYMRFRAPPVPEPAPKEAATMTKISGRQAQQLDSRGGIRKQHDVAVDATTTANSSTWMAPLDFDNALTQARLDHKKRTSPPAYMKRTVSSQHKVTDPLLTSRSSKGDGEAAEQALPSSARRPSTSSARLKSSFETALEKQKQHGPGEAVVMDENELQRILEIAGKTNFNAQHKRPDSARPRGQFTGFA